MRPLTKPDVPERTRKLGDKAAILERVIKPGESNLPAAAARALLRLEFDSADQRRMKELAQKNRDEKLSGSERAELDDYVQIGLVLDLFRAKARRSLERRNSRS